MTKRIEQVDLLIKKELSKIILKEVDFPNDVLVTITRVETTGNLIESRVFVSVLPEKKLEEVFKILDKNIYILQQAVNRRLIMRPMPKIIFIKEEKTKEAGRIEELLEQLKKDNR